MTGQATRMTGGEALVAALAAHGTDLVFGIPGTHNLAVYAQLSRYGIRHVSPRHEQGAGYAADGWARVTGRPGVCLTTSGPAILNAAAAACQAWSDSVPVLFVSPGLPLDHPGLGNGYLHEVRNQSAAMAAIVHTSLRVTSVAEIPVAVSQAFATMCAGRPRPVHLEIPLDVMDAEAEVGAASPVPLTRPMPSDDLLRRAADLLAGAERPCLIVGGGARHAAEQLAALVAARPAPVLATTNGKGVLPEDHELSLGAGLQHPSVSALLADSDVVLAIGTELAPSDLWLGPPRFGGRLIRIDIDPVGIITNARPDLALVGDAGGTLAALTDLLSGTPAGGRPDVDEWRRRIRAEARAEGELWLPVVDALAAALDRTAIVAGDSAMAVYYGALSNLPAYAPAGFLYPTGGGTLGYGLPAAIGARLADPNRQVVAMLGDGGVMFTIQELASAAAEGLPIAVLIVDNSGYGEIHREMAERGDQPLGVRLPSPDFVALAHSLGCFGFAVDTTGELTARLRAARDADRPTVIVVREGMVRDA